MQLPPELIQLPPELLILIFSYLNEKQLVSVSLICNEWKNISEDNSLWLKLANKNIEKNPVTTNNNSETITLEKNIEKPAIQLKYIVSQLFLANEKIDSLNETINHKKKKLAEKKPDPIPKTQQQPLPLATFVSFEAFSFPGNHNFNFFESCIHWINRKMEKSKIKKMQIKLDKTLEEKSALINTLKIT